MKQVNEILSEPFPYCRVGYNKIDGKIYLGEIKSYYPSGWICLDSIECHKVSGSLLELGSR